MVTSIAALKFRSSMTLFDLVAPDDIFAKELDYFYDGRRDEKTLELLEKSQNNTLPL